jgi:quinol-cytochrome oxidoreductase complex cytochrome b subunit
MLTVSSSLHKFLRALSVWDIVLPTHIRRCIHSYLRHGTIIELLLFCTSSSLHAINCVSLSGVLLVIIATLDIISGKVHDVIGTRKWIRLIIFRFIVLNCVLLSIWNKFDVLQSFTIIIQTVHCVYTLMHLFTSWLYCLIHFLWRDKLYESLGAHRSIQLL